MRTCTALLTSQHQPPLSRLLEVDELGLVGVEVEAGAVVADGVPADGWWRVLELLRDVFDQRLAVHAQEGTAHLQTPNTESLDLRVPTCEGVC